MDTRYLTPAQVAERLQVTEFTVYKWLRAGELRSVKLGRLWRISEGDLAEFLGERRGAVPSRPGAPPQAEGVAGAGGGSEAQQPPRVVSGPPSALQLPATSTDV